MVRLMGTSTAGGKSQPRWASGGCSVYRRKDFVTSIVISRADVGGNVSDASKSIGRPCASGGIYDMIDSRSSITQVKIRNTIQKGKV